MEYIIQSIENLVQEYTLAISEEYEIEIKDLQELWKKISKKQIKSSKDEESKTTKKKTQSKSKKNDEEDKGDGQCNYVYTRKPRSGERCSVKVKSGGLYCSTHKGSENKSPKEKSVIPKVTKKESPKKESPKKEVIRKPTFRLNNDIKKHVHPETNLVLKSATDKKIIGKLENKEIIDLTEEDIEICKKYGFIIDDEQLEKLKSNNEEEEEEEEEEEQETNVIDKFLIKDSWSNKHQSINGKINKNKLESLIKKKVLKGDYDEEYESEGYPITLNIDTKSKKILVKYTDGKGKENNINITSNSDDDLSNLYEFIKELKSDGSKSPKKDSKSQDDNLFKKSPKKEIKERDDEEDIEDIEDILDEVEENEEEEEELLEDDE
jgi:hypothetical protein